MAIRDTNDPSGIDAVLIDRLLGLTAYEVVKTVVLNIDAINTIAPSVDDLVALAEARASLVSLIPYLPALQEIADQVDDVVALVANVNAAATATAADRLQTGLDRTAVASDKALTHTDRLAADADAVATAADRVQTGLDRVQTGLDRAAVAANAAGLPNLADYSADIAIRTLDVVRASNGPTGKFTNGRRSNVHEFRQTGVGAPTTRIRIGGLSDEANVSFNMNYDDGTHRADDYSRNSVWLALNNNGAFIQKGYKGYAGTGDFWYDQGSHYLWAVHNLGTGNADVWTAYFPGKLYIGSGNALNGTKNYIDASAIQLADSTGISVLAFNALLSQAKISTTYYPGGSDIPLILQAGPVTNQIRLWPGAGGEIELNCGLTSGSPTGGNKGPGTLNAKAVYDDNTQLTGYALDGGIAFMSGEDPIAAIRLEHYDYLCMGEEHFGARKFLGKLSSGKNPLDLRWYSSDWMANRHLSSMPNETKYDVTVGLPVGAMTQRLVETVELQAVHDLQLLRMIDDLRAEFEAYKAENPKTITIQKG